MVHTNQIYNIITNIAAIYQLTNYQRLFAAIADAECPCSFNHLKNTILNLTEIAPVFDSSSDSFHTEKM